ncbi:MAG: riboflavin biosynthesis protein RibF [Planctomycetota bacterium]|nr:riboflavin biosynthesis protein RibF [Planctomycetota bacterium]
MTTIIIGNFDGVHIGHQGLIRRARDYSPTSDVVAVTFDSHPALQTRGEAPPMLTTNQVRERLLIESGVHRVECLKTTAELLALTPDAFVELLQSRINFSAVVEGEDFRFGCRRSGDVNTLREIGRRKKFETIVADDVDVALHDGQIVSARSSMVRWLLANGRVADARRMLGRSYSVAGIVVLGQQRGRQLGYPTANLAQLTSLLPSDGVYSVGVEDAQGRHWRGAASIGSNPTFGECPRTLEVHVLDLPKNADLYGQMMRISFHEWLRGMMRFDSVDVLVAQIARDCAQVVA